MASNVTNYKNLTPAAKLDKKVLNQMAWRSLFLQGSFNFQRMQSNGWLYSIIPGLKKIHTEKDDLSTSMGHNLEFFNTHPFLVTFVMGIVLSLEQQKADIPMIRAVRVAAMGPLGGIGDAIFWFTLIPIAAGISADLALNGNILGPFVFLAMFNVVHFGVRYWLMHWSYELGVNAIDALTKNAKEFTRAASILGVLVVGALTSIYGGTTTALVLNPEAEEPIIIQEVLDGIMPKLIPLGLTLLLFYLIKNKGWSPVKGIILVLVLGLVGALVGFF